MLHASLHSFFLDDLPVGVFHTDINGYCVYVNGALQVMTGLSKEKVLGQGWIQALHEADRDRVLAAWMKTVKTKQAFNLNFRFQKPGGEVVWVVGQSRQLADDEGNCIGFVGTLTDISENTQFASDLHQSNALRYERNFLNAIFQATNAVVVVLDRAGQIVRFNKAAEKLSGYSEEEVLGTCVWDRLLPDETKAEVKQVFLSLKTKTMENEYINEWVAKDNSRHLIQWSNDVISGDDGQVEYVVAMGIDITEKKFMEESAAQSKAQFEAVFNAMADSAVYADPDRNMIAVNKAAIDTFGFSEKELLGHPTTMLYAKQEDFQATGRQRFSSSASGNVKPYEVQYQRKDGRVFWGETVGTKVFAEDGGLLGFVGIIRDVSERKKVGAELVRASAAMDSALDAVVIGDTQGNIVYCNKAFLALWRADDKEQVLGYSGKKFWRYDDAEAMTASLNDKGEWVGEGVAVRCDGSSFSVRLATTLLKDDQAEVMGVLATFVDLTKQKRIEQELIEKQQTLSKAQAIAHFGSWDWDIISGDLQWSDEIYRIFGYAPQELNASYEAFLQAIPERDRQRVVDNVNAAVNDPDQVYEVEHSIIRPDGELRYVREHGLVYRDTSGNPFRMIGTVHDITESKLTLEELSRFKTTLDLTHDCVFMFYPDDLRFFYVNQGAMDQVGYSADEMLKMRPFDIKPEYSEAAFRQLLTPMIDGAMPMKYFETVHRSKNGTLIPVEIFLQYIKPQGQKARFVAIVRDITERKAVEAELARYQNMLEEQVEERTKELREAHDQLLKKERLATLGQLTATVSHELRNPLGAIKTSLYVIKRKLENSEDARMQDAISRVDRNVLRCDHIIDELLDFTRLTQLTPSNILLNDWLKETLDEIAVAQGIEMETIFDGRIQQVSFDPSRMRRAIVNVVDNACQSMLKANSSTEYRDGAVVFVATRFTAERFEISVRDQGSGMSAEVIQRIFEPLFSTKGFGVGLGMPTVRQIMLQHGGNVEVDSRAGEGSTVVLWWPRHGVDSMAENEVPEWV